MKARRLHIGIASAAILIAGATVALPRDLVIRPVSASIDVGYYVRIPWAKPEPGSIVTFAIPERARALAERGGMNLDLPLMKRVEAITPDGRLVVKGDCGGSRSLDSRYFGSLDPADVLGVYAPVPWTMTPCRELVGGEEEGCRKGREEEPDKAGFPQKSAALGKPPFPVPQTCGTLAATCGRPEKCLAKSSA